MKKLVDNMIHCIHTEPITPVNQRRPSLRFFDKVSEEMRLLKVKSFDTSLRYNAAVVGLDRNKYE